MDYKQLSDLIFLVQDKNYGVFADLIALAGLNDKLTRVIDKAIEDTPNLSLIISELDVPVLIGLLIRDLNAKSLDIIINQILKKISDHQDKRLRKTYEVQLMAILCDKLIAGTESNRKDIIGLVNKYLK